MTNDEQGWLERFKAKAQEFFAAMERLTRLEHLASKDPDNAAQHRRLVSRGEKIRATIQGIISTITGVSDWAGNVFSFNSVDATKKMLSGNPDNGLGFAWFLPIAAVSAAIAAMTKFISDVYLFERRVQEQQRLENEGHTAQEASRIIRSNYGGEGFLSSVIGAGRNVAIVGVIAFTAYKFIGAKK